MLDYHRLFYIAINFTIALSVQFKKKKSCNLFSIKNNLLELARLSKALDDLVGDVSSEVHTKSKGGIRCLHQVPQLF